MRFKGVFLVLIFLVTGCLAMAQCPPNIGFEEGNFTNWKCYTGTLVYNVGDENPPVLGPPDPSRHCMFTNTSPQELDPYGLFPVNCPNGSHHSIRLGDAAVSGNGDVNPAMYERVTYDFTVPTDNYTLICYYAVVFQNPRNHPPEEKPKMIAKVHNLDDPSDDGSQCGEFEFTAQAGLQGFMVSKIDTETYYKPWSALIITIGNRKGKKFQLDFTTHDCSQGAHFGYAYLDFNEGNCNDPITGNLYCAGQDTVTLTAPPGFQNYIWGNATGDTLSLAPTLKISPPPANGTQYSVHLVPYAGLGCENTFTTEIQQTGENFVLKVQAKMTGCLADGVDITTPQITQGSSTLNYDYFEDENTQIYLSDPKHITKPGIYYIRGTNASGCTGVAPIEVQLFNGPVLTVKTPVPACKPATVDLTQYVTPGETDATISYFSDAALKVPVANPHAVAATGLYYVKETSAIVHCSTVEPMSVIVSDLPVARPLTYKSCPPLNLNNAVIASGLSEGNAYQFFTDVAGVNLINDPTGVTAGGTYYYKLINQYGCESTIKPITAIVLPEPTFTVKDPIPVIFPATVSLVGTHTVALDATFTYWLDKACTKPLVKYMSVEESGTYYIKANNGCDVIHPVHVSIGAPPEANLVFGNTFTPNGDGINDVFSPEIQGVVQIEYIKIFNRYGKEVFQSKDLYMHWDGSLNGKPQPAGAYYWVFSAYDIYRKQIVKRAGLITIIR